MFDLYAHPYFKLFLIGVRGAKYETRATNTYLNQFEHLNDTIPYVHGICASMYALVGDLLNFVLQKCVKRVVLHDS